MRSSPTPILRIPNRDYISLGIENNQKAVLFRVSKLNRRICAQWGQTEKYRDQHGLLFAYAVKELLTANKKPAI
jgi:hypothetical protein